MTRVSPSSNCAVGEGSSLGASPLVACAWCRPTLVGLLPPESPEHYLKTGHFLLACRPTLHPGHPCTADTPAPRPPLNCRHPCTLATPAPWSPPVPHPPPVPRPSPCSPRHQSTEPVSRQPQCPRLRGHPLKPLYPGILPRTMTHFNDVSFHTRARKTLKKADARIGKHSPVVCLTHPVTCFRVSAHSICFVKLGSYSTYFVLHRKLTKPSTFDCHTSGCDAKPQGGLQSGGTVLTQERGQESRVPFLRPCVISSHWIEQG